MEGESNTSDDLLLKEDADTKETTEGQRDNQVIEENQPDEEEMEIEEEEEREEEEEGEEEEEMGEARDDSAEEVDSLLMVDNEEDPWCDVGDDLVPIRLDLFIDGVTFKDTFIWDLNETSVTPEHFARTLCMEMDYPQQFEETVAANIHKQLNSFHTWRRAFREKRIRIPSAESLILIQLNLTVNEKSLQDQFEWDIRNEHVSPESFAHSLCCDLGLSREFEVSIAHSIREQINRHLQAIVDNNLMREQWVRPIVVDAVRDEEELPLWTPSISSTPAVPLPYINNSLLLREKLAMRASRRDRRPSRNRSEGSPASPIATSSIAGDSSASGEESKRKHALNRPRGPRGRFLSKEVQRTGPEDNKQDGAAE